MPTTKGGGSRIPLKIGGTLDYALVDTVNHKITIFINGSKVHEWS